MERDDELKGNNNSYDFRARIYDPRVAKFLSIDPRWKEFTALSPYCFVADNPIILIDPTGMIIEPASNLSGKDLQRVETAIQKLSEERPKQYAFIQNLRYHQGMGVFISNPENEYYQDATPIVVHVTTGDLDGKPYRDEKRAYENSIQRSGQQVDNTAGSHTNANVGSSSNWSISGAGNGMARVKGADGEYKLVPFTDPYQSFGNDRPQLKYNIQPANEGEYHLIITIDDFTGGNSGSSGDLELLTHEVGHIEGDIMDIRGAASDKANTKEEDRPGHDNGQIGGQIADDREKSDRPK